MVDIEFFNRHIDEVSTLKEPWTAVAYEKCYIRLTNGALEFETPPFVVNGNGDAIELRRESQGWILPFTVGYNPFGYAEGVTVGDVTVYWKMKGHLQGKKNINITPSILSLTDFESMLKDIGLIGVSLKAFMQSNLRVKTGDGDGGINPSAVLTRIKAIDPDITKIENFIGLVKRQLSVIEQKPCYDLVQSVGLLAIVKSYHAKHLIQRKINSQKRVVQGITKSMSMDSYENQWLVQFSNHKLLPLIDLLETRSKSVSNFDSDEKNTNNEDFKLKEILDLRIEQLRKDVDIIKKHPFIQKIKFTSSLNKVITTRLLTRSGYSTIYNAYNNLFSEDVIKDLAKYEVISEAIAKGTLRSIANIYEIWCFFELYNQFVTKLKFEPVDPELTLFNNLNLKDGFLEFPKNEMYSLKRNFAGQSLEVDLIYEGNLKRKEGSASWHPDIIIKIRAPKRFYGYNKDEFIIVLDAKFHDYKSSVNKKLLMGDVVDVAMGKYYSYSKVKPDMSMILHPNHGDKYTWLGEQKFVDFLNMDKAVYDARIYENIQIKVNKGVLPIEIDDDCKGFVAHKLGALAFRAGSRVDVSRLFSIIFHYHLGLTSLCLCCGKELKEQREFLKNDSKADQEDGNKKFWERFIEYQRYIYSYSNEDVYSDFSFFEKNKIVTKKMFEAVNEYWHEREYKDKLYLDKDWSDEDPTTAFRAVCGGCKSEWRISFCSDSSHDTTASQSKSRPSSKNRIVKIGRVEDESTKKRAWYSIHLRDEMNKKMRCPGCEQWV